MASNTLPPIIAAVRMDITQALAKLDEYTAAVGATVASTTASFDASKAEMNAWNKETSEATSAVTTGFLAVGAGVAVAAGASIKLAADFESATTRLVTSAGESDKQIGMVRQGILDMAGQVGDSAQELATAMYMVDSANIHGADSLTVLRAAAEGAKAENADLTTVVEAETSAMADYHLGADKAADTTSKLVAATSMGKTTFQGLSGAMHTVLPDASAAHVALGDVLGDLASMTEHGISADQATQDLDHTIQHLTTTTQPQQKELALLGLNAQQLSNDLGAKGLSGTLIEISNAIQQRMGPDGKVILDMQTALKGLPPEVQKLGVGVMNGTVSVRDFTMATKDLNVQQAGLAHSFATLETSTHGIGSAQKSGAQITQNYTQALKAATGDSTTLSTALMLTGENADYTTKAVQTVSGASAEAGGHVKGWSEIQATFNQHLARAKDSADSAGISFGTRLLPMASQAMDEFVKAEPTLVAAGNHLIDVAVGAGRVASALGPLTPVLATAVGLFVAWRTAMTIGAALEGVVTLVAAFVEQLVVVASTEGIAAAAQWALNIAMDANPIGLVIIAIAALIAIIVLAVTHWHQITDAVGGAWRATTSFLSTHRELIYNIPLVGGPIHLVVDLVQLLTQHWHDITSAVGEVFSELGRFGDWLRNTFGPILSNIGSTIGGVASDIGNLIGQAKNIPVIGGAAHAAGIPGFASGGLVTRPTLAMVGEAGPELIVPLKDINRGDQATRYASQMSGQAAPQQGMDDTNDLLASLYRLLDERLPRTGGSAFSNRAYGPA